MIIKPQLSRRITNWLALRKALGLTQNSFGHFIGLSQKSIWELETGRQQAISHNTERSLRAFLRQPKVQRLLIEAGVKHPYPEDIT